MGPSRLHGCAAGRREISLDATANIPMLRAPGGAPAPGDGQAMPVDARAIGRTCNADRSSRPPHENRLRAAAGRRRIAGGGGRRRRRLRQRQSGGPRLARHHRRPDLHRPHQGRPHRARRASGDRAGIAGHHRHRRPLGLRLPRQCQGDAADHRQGEEDQRRRLHRVPPEPRRPARRLSADGDQGGHDRPRHRGLRPLAQGRGAVRRPRGAARHQSRSRSPCRPTSTRPSISTWRPRRWRPAR